MADRGKVEYGVATGNDLAAHNCMKASCNSPICARSSVVNVAIGLCASEGFWAQAGASASSVSHR